MALNTRNLFVFLRLPFFVISYMLDLIYFFYFSNKSMVCTAGEGGHPPRVCRLRVRGRRDQDPSVRGDGGVRQVQQRTLRASGLKVGSKGI